MSELSGEILGASSQPAAGSVESEAPSRDAIARRAYEISQSEHAGTDEENWRRAEQELWDEAASAD